MNNTHAGKLADLITIERAAELADDGMSRQASGWFQLCQAWAEVNYGRGSERRIAAQENANIPATFRIRATPVTALIDARDRIRFDNVLWDISSNVPFGRAWRDVTAIRSG